MRDMAGKPKPRSVAQPRRAQKKAKPKPRAKPQRISGAKPRTRAKREPEPFMVTYDVVILSPDGTYDIESMDVLNVPNFTYRDVVKCFREDHAEELDPKAMLAVLIAE
jgi:hypothetical protein